MSVFSREYRFRAESLPWVALTFGGVAAAVGCAVSEDVSDEALLAAEAQYAGIAGPQMSAAPVASTPPAASSPATPAAKPTATSTGRPAPGGMGTAAAPVASGSMKMTWTTCDPAKAAAVCPTQACDVNTLCKAGAGVFERDCVSWCQGVFSCVTSNKACITKADPLCISSYAPRDPCVDYIDANNPKSKGASGASNYATSWGTKAATALLNCACGG